MDIGPKLLLVLYDLKLVTSVYIQLIFDQLSFGIDKIHLFSLHILSHIYYSYHQQYQNNKCTYMFYLYQFNIALSMHEIQEN
jgi:hypothetical protein